MVYTYLKMKLNILLFISVFFILNNSNSQINSPPKIAIPWAGSQFLETDSLLHYFNLGEKLSTALENKFTSQLGNTDSIEIAKFSNKIYTKENKAKYYHQIGRSFYFLNDYELSRKYFAEALRYAKQTSNKSLIALESSVLGNAYRLQDRNTIALEYLFQATTLYRELKDERQTAVNLSLIGDLNRVINQPKNALKYLKEAMEISTQNGFLEEQAMCLSSMGAVYLSQGYYMKAKNTFEKGLALAEAINSPSRMIEFQYNIGDLLIEEGDTENALEAFKHALKLSTESNDQYNISSCYLGIAKVNLKQQQYKSAIKFGTLGYEIGRTLTAAGVCADAVDILYKAYFAVGDYKNAFQSIKLKMELNDRTTNLAQVKQQSQLEFKFINSYKEKQDSTIRAQKEYQRDLIQQAKSKQQESIVFAGLISIAIAILIIIIIFRFYRKEKTSKQIIEYQKTIVELKNKEILDSINYAKRIQQAIIPSTIEINQLFPNNFVMLLPRDIVSGDFYWIGSNMDHTYIALADCTGHGVPGGFMSMLGTALLNEIIIERKIYEPADILDLLKLKIIMALRQSENVNEAKDGMDIALCRINRVSNELVFAGANNSMHLARGNDLIELKGDKQPIGISHFNTTQQFIQKTISLTKDDVIYLFTDGFADQFGGEKGKKFKYKKLEELLVRIREKDMEEQLTILKDVLSDWKGDLDQVDDICILGIKI